MVDSDCSSNLRAHLERLDQALGGHANEFWRRAFEIHERQTGLDANKGGFSHVIQVENNVWRYLEESGSLAEISAFEVFLLSCAACSHDFDKGLKSARPEGDHGVASGRFVHQHRAELGLDKAEGVAVDCIDSVHDYRGAQFLEKLEELPDEYGTVSGSIDLRRLALVLKVADTLQTDQTRISDLAADVDNLEGKDRSKHLGRACITGAVIDRKKVMLQAYRKRAPQP